MVRDNPRVAYPNLKSLKQIPTLKGFVVGEQIHVWCPYCNDFHTHGAKDANPAMKHHRVAHCFDRFIGGKIIPCSSPFLETGYYIKPFSKAELKRIGVVPAGLKG